MANFLVVIQPNRSETPVAIIHPDIASSVIWDIMAKHERLTVLISSKSLHWSLTFYGRLNIPSELNSLYYITAYFTATSKPIH